MSIRTRLTWQFTIIVATILIFFYIAIYFFYADFRRDEFYSRLTSKALTIARLLIDVQEIDHDLLKIIERNSLNALHNEKIYIFDGQIILYTPPQTNMIARYLLICCKPSGMKSEWNIPAGLTKP